MIRRRLAGAMLIVAAGGSALGFYAAARPRGATEPVAATPAVSPGPPSRGGRITFAPASRPIALLPNGERRRVSSILRVDGPLSYGEFVWNDAGVPRGPVWVRIDLDSQLLSIFRAGHEIGTAVVLYGADQVPTPIGSFPILAKMRDHVSSLYDAPMPYTLRLTQDGVSIHGSNVRRGAATHGCVGVPTAFAARLFDQLRVGDRVVIVRQGRTSKS